MDRDDEAMYRRIISKGDRIIRRRRAAGRVLRVTNVLIPILALIVVLRYDVLSLHEKTDSIYTWPVSRLAENDHVVEHFLPDLPSFGSYEGLCEAADVVVIGTVISCRSFITEDAYYSDADDFPYLLYEIDVQKGIKGTQVNDHISIVLQGGEKNGVLYHGMYDLKRGGQYFFALELSENGFYKAVDCAEGIVAVDERNNIPNY